MNLSHQYRGDFERLAAAAVGSFNEMFPPGSGVMLQPDPKVVAQPVRARIMGAAFVQGAEIVVRVQGEAEPVSIKRLRKEGAA